MESDNSAKRLDLICIYIALMIFMFFVSISINKNIKENLKETKALRESVEAISKEIKLIDIVVEEYK